MRFYYLIYLKIGSKLWQRLGICAGTVIIKETKEPNHRVLLGALLFGSFGSFVVRNVCLGTYRRNLIRH